MAEHGMSKRQQQPQPQQNTKKQPAAATVQPLIEVPAETARSRTIEDYRHCPLCWEGNGGYGVAYSTNGRTRYYKCCKTAKEGSPGPCGHTWTALVKLEVIRVEHRVVQIEGQR